MTTAKFVRRPFAAQASASHNAEKPRLSFAAAEKASDVTFFKRVESTRYDIGNLTRT